MFSEPNVVMNAQIHMVGKHMYMCMYMSHVMLHVYMCLVTLHWIDPCLFPGLSDDTVFPRVHPTCVWYVSIR